MRLLLKYKLQTSMASLAALTLACALLSQPSHSAQLRMVTGDDGVAAYAKGVLKVALNTLEDEFEWDETASVSTEGRASQMIEDQKLDIAWFATTNDFESRMLPIRIPIYKGLFGYRIFMIKKGTQSLFDNIHTLKDINKISIGQGRLWADTDIMEANGIDVVKVTKYEGLFYMLDGGRFDAFPRGVHEPWYEMARYPDLELTVETGLMMSYTNPFYFFVNKNNHKLAEKIERGLRLAIEDGSFDQYFFNDPTITSILENGNLSSRKVIKLDNPLLPPNTPVHEASLWVDPSEL